MNCQKYSDVIITFLSILLVLSIGFIAISFATNNIHWISTLFKQEPSFLNVYQQKNVVGDQLITTNAYEVYFSAKDNYKTVILAFKMKDKNNNIFYEEKIIFEDCKKGEGYCKIHHTSTENMLKAKHAWCELVSYY